MAKTKRRDSLPVNEEKLSDLDLDLNESSEPKESKITGSVEPPSLEQSPLLNAEREYVEHSAPIQDQSTTSENENANDGNSFRYDDNSTASSTSQSSSSSSTVTDNGGVSDTASDVMDLPGEGSAQASKQMSDFIMDAYERFAPEAGLYFAKINAKEIKKLEDSGDLQPGSYQLVVEHNKQIRQELEDKADKDAKYIKKHLTKVLVVRNVQASPETLLAFAIIIVVVGQFVLIKRMVDEKNILFNNLMDKVNTNRNNSFNTTTTTEKEEIEVVQAEEV